MDGHPHLLEYGRTYLHKQALVNLASVLRESQDAKTNS